MIPTISQLLEERATARLYADWNLYSRRRPAIIRALGVILQPDTVADAWHATGCPPSLDRSFLSPRDRFVWAVARVLRGSKPR